jgi:hypothetical protein
LIAEEGYGAEGRLLQSSVRYPLFPLLSRAVSELTGISSAQSLFWVSKIGLLMGLIALWLLVDHLHDTHQADRAMIYMAFPLLGTGYTWLMSYPESLHLLTWALGFLFLLRGRYAWCGLVTVLGIWTRPQALLILPGYAVILIEAYRRGEFKSLFDRRLWQAGLLSCGPPLLAAAIWMLYISDLADLPLSPITAQAGYLRGEFRLPWERIVQRIQWMLSGDPLNRSWSAWFEAWHLLVIVLSLGILGGIAWRGRLPWGIWVFSLSTVGLGLSTAVYAVGRFALLTWIPLAALYVIPEDYDRYLMPVTVSLAFLSVTVLGLSTSAGYFP